MADTEAKTRMITGFPRPRTGEDGMPSCPTSRPGIACRSAGSGPLKIRLRIPAASPGRSDPSH